MKKFLKKLYKILAVVWRTFINLTAIWLSFMVLYGIWTNSPYLYHWMVGMGLYDLYYLSYRLQDIQKSLTNVRENQRTLIGLIYKIFN